MKNIKFAIISTIFILFNSTPSLSESKGVWSLWVVPNKYTINQGEWVELTFGLTGFGSIDQSKLKITAYSETGTFIQHGEENGQYDTYAIAPNMTSPINRFTKAEERAANTIITISDHNSGFGKFFLTPKSPGDKKLTLIATYFVTDDGWHSSRYDFDYHVNTWTEEHQTFITIISILSAILAIGLLPSVGERVFRSLKEKFKKI